MSMIFIKSPVRVDIEVIPKIIDVGGECPLLGISNKRDSNATIFSIGNIRFQNNFNNHKLV